MTALDVFSLDSIPADEDPLLVWAAQDLRPGMRAWALGDAVAVARQQVANRDRIAVRGSAADVSELLRRIRSQVEGLHPIGDEDLIARVDGIETIAQFGWMATTACVPDARSELVRVGDEQAGAFLDENHPHSFARPGWPGVERWLGQRDSDSGLLAVATDAWTTSRIGFISGVATRRDRRGRGLATKLCGALTNHLLTGRHMVALLVDHDNLPAVRTYERLGYTMRRVAAASYVG